MEDVLVQSLQIVGHYSNLDLTIVAQESFLIEQLNPE